MRRNILTAVVLLIFIAREQIFSGNSAKEFTILGIQTTFLGGKNVKIDVITWQMLPESLFENQKVQPAHFINATLST